LGLKALIPLQSRFRVVGFALSVQNKVLTKLSCGSIETCFDPFAQRSLPFLPKLVVILLPDARLFLPLRNGFLTRLALICQLHALEIRLPDVFES
jgi:hypothetical protein